MRRFLTALAVVALVGVSGCGDSEPSLSDTLTGSTWLSQYDFHQSFHDDGTYAVDERMFRAEGDVSAADTEWGTWTLNENVLSVTANAKSPWCAGVTGTYLLKVADDGNRIEISLQEDPCKVRSGPGGLPSGLTREP